MPFRKFLSIFMLNAIVTVFLPLPVGAFPSQGRGEEVLVIEGGTLIDGTGNTPQTDMRMVIRNGRIQEIGPRSEVVRPVQGRVIDAQGKFILPGLIDSHVHYFGYEGELYLNHGVTTVMSLGGIPEWDQAQAEAIARGDVVGPRMFTAGNPLGAPPGAPIGMPTLGMPHWLHVRDGEEGIQVVQMLLDKGVDYIKIYRGVPTAERASLMQRELFPELIELLIQEDVYLETSLNTNAFKGFHPLSDKFLWEDAVLLSDTNLLYVTDYQRRRWFDLQNHAVPLDPKTKERVDKGYENFVLFLRQFVEAGGKLLVGSDAEGKVPPGISLHHELELLVHGGILSPMQAIVSTTRLPAEFLGRSNDLGSLEKGKIADLVLLNSDPLQDIGNTRDIFAVLKEGQEVELAYHRYFTNPIPRPWLSGSGRHPSPRIQSFPPAVSCNRPGVVVTIKGTGFMPTSFVRVNGVGQDIEFVGRSEIKTTLDCKELNIPGTSSLVVVNPEPINEGDSDVSNAVKFLVTK